LFVVSGLSAPPITCFLLTQPQRLSLCCETVTYRSWLIPVVKLSDRQLLETAGLDAWVRHLSLCLPVDFLCTWSVNPSGPLTDLVVQVSIRILTFGVALFTPLTIFGIGVSECRAALCTVLSQPAQRHAVHRCLQSTLRSVCAALQFCPSTTPVTLMITPSTILVTTTTTRLTPPSLT
jgi:hypothetical protein